MPTFRTDITSMRSYQVGRQLADVARSHGLDPADIVKLTANESPEGPFPGVAAAAAEVLSRSNRYPDSDCWDLGHALADELQVDFSNILFGAGTMALLTEIGTLAGGHGTNIVYGWPSFVMYRFVTTWAGSTHVEVTLSEDHRLDLDGMRAAIDSDTRVVIVCNPNNPTGTIRAVEEIEAFIDSIPDSVLVVVDEAYHDFVTDPRYHTEIPLAVNRPNVLVLRTFSKIYSLAAHRIGYAIGRPDTLVELRKAQPPLTVSQVAQVAARASLGQNGELERRRSDNSARRHHLMGALAERGLPMAESHTNFIYFSLGNRTDQVVAAMTSVGVLIRSMSGDWVRVTVGNDEENRRFVQTLDMALAGG